MILRRDIEHLHRVDDQFRIHGLCNQTVNQFGLSGDAHAFLDCGKVLIRHRPDHRRRFLLALREIEHLDRLAVFIKEADCLAAGRNGKAGFFPLRGSCDEGRIGLLREKFQRNRSRMLENSALKPEKLRQELSVCSHVPEHNRSGITVSAKRGEVTGICH